MSYPERMTEQYKAYLESEAWKVRAKQRLEIDNYTCQGCGSKGGALNPLQIHHLRYDNIYHEDIYRDLVTLCRSCHAILHNALNRVTSPDGKRGFKENPNVPHVNTFVLSGLDLQTRKGNLENAKRLS